MAECQIINVHFFRPGFKNIKQRCEIIECDACEHCALYQNQQCVISRGFFGPPEAACPHGRLIIEEGHTRKAKSYASWFLKKEKQYGPDKVDKLTCNHSKLCIVGGDYVYLPYNHLKTYVNQVKGIVKEHFLKLEDFTTEKIAEILAFVPRTLIDNSPISSYEKEMRTFIQHLKEVMPDLYTQFLSDYPEYQEFCEETVTNYVGRTAKISTLKNGSILLDCHDNEWVITDKYLVCENCDTSLMIPFGNPPAKVTIEITDEMTYKVTDNSSVTAETIFID